MSALLDMNKNLQINIKNAQLIRVDIILTDYLRPCICIACCLGEWRPRACRVVVEFSEV